MGSMLYRTILHHHMQHALQALENKKNPPNNENAQILLSFKEFPVMW